MEDSTVEKIFNKIDNIEQNTTEIKVSVAELPCKVHEERFKSYDKSIKKVWGVILVILTMITGLSLIAVIALIDK